MVEVEPKRRIRMEEIKEHAWLKKLVNAKEVKQEMKKRCS
jgi:hypothetical protein